MTRRVVVTGIGSVSPLAPEDPFADLRGALGASPSETRSRPIDSFDAGDLINPRALRRMNRFSQLAYAGVVLALRDAELEITPEIAERTGMIFNTYYGPFDSTRAYLTKLIRDGAKKASAGVFPSTVHNAFTGLITLDLKMLGTSSTVSGYNPICYGIDMIREGRDDIMVVGGCDELTSVIESGFGEAGLFGDGSRFAVAEGAGVLVLESDESARARGRRPLAEILDYGSTSVGGGESAAFPSDAEAVSHAMRDGLQRSGLDAADVDLLSAGRNGLPAVDAAEEQAVAEVFGTAPRTVEVRTALGDALSAAALFSTIVGVRALEDAGSDIVMVNDFELGGTFSSLLLRRAEAGSGVDTGVDAGAGEGART